MRQSLIQSKYNYIINQGEKSYWFNTISRGYIVIDKTLSYKLQYILGTDASMLEKKSPKLYQQLIDENFIVDGNIDEVDIVRQKHREAVESKDYRIIVLPTLNCNYKCWYCIQDHIDTKMSEQTMEALKKHINYMINEEHIQSLHIDWFGGEPFMYFKEVVEPISSYAKAQCEVADIPFILSATSNAYYLTEDTYETLDLLGFSNFQITLDGVRDVHNKVKFSENGGSAFDRALNNIDGLLSTAKRASIALRINYTADNLDESIVEQVNDAIKIENRKRISVYFRKVWQEQTDNNRAEKINYILSKFHKFGYYVQSLDLFGNFLPCYTDRRYFNSINYNGNVLKCTASDDLYSNNTPGKLRDDGRILWQDGFLENFHKPKFENGICVKCKQLPMCMGPCCNKPEGNFVCEKNLTDRSIEERIINYVEISEIKTEATI